MGAVTPSIKRKVIRRYQYRAGWRRSRTQYYSELECGHSVRHSSYEHTPKIDDVIPCRRCKARGATT